MWGTDPEQRGAAVLKLFIYTLVGSLLMLVGAIATGVLAGQERGDIDVRAQRRCGEPRLDRLAEVDLPRLRARVPDQDAVVPVPRLDAGRVPADADRAARGLHRDPLEGRRLRLPADRAAAVPATRRVEFQELLLLVALALDPLRLGDGVHDDATRGSCSATRRSRSSASSCSGSSRSTRAAADGALLQSVNHALVSVPLIFVVALLAARAGGSEDLRDMGGIATRAPVFAARLPRPDVRAAGDARHRRTSSASS